MKKALILSAVCSVFALFANDDIKYYTFSPAANPGVRVKDSMILLSAGKQIVLNLPDAADWGDLKMKLACQYKLENASAVTIKAEFKNSDGKIQKEKIYTLCDLPEGHPSLNE